MIIDIRSPTRAFINVLLTKNTTQLPAAIDYFKGFKTTDILYPRAQFNLGYSYLLQEQTAAAITTFRALLKSTYPKNVQQDAAFYLALTQIRQGDTTSATERLQSIENQTDHKHNKSAQELLKQLKSPWRTLIF